MEKIPLLRFKIFKKNGLNINYPKNAIFTLEEIINI